jgi:Plasmid pRiA4b ORF-3-like protein
MAFHDNPCKIFIGDLGFRAGDKFTYDYDFGDDWEHEIRVEKIEEWLQLKKSQKFPTTSVEFFESDKITVK